MRLLFWTGSMRALRLKAGTGYPCVATKFRTYWVEGRSRFIVDTTDELIRHGSQGRAHLNHQRGSSEFGILRIIAMPR